MEIYDKTQIKAALRKSFGAVVYALDQLSSDAFLLARAEGKWAPGDILGHLILSTKPIRKAMSLPKLILAGKFGKINRKEHSLEGVKEKYYRGLSQGITAPANFVFEGVATKGKEALINSFTMELNKLLEKIDEWSENDLSTYLIPHPAIGMLTFREMLFFTHIHTLHHLEQITSEISV